MLISSYATLCYVIATGELECINEDIGIEKDSTSYFQSLQGLS